MRKSIVTAAIFLWALVGWGCVQRVLETAPAHSVPSEVPEAYRGIYQELDSELHRQIPIIAFPWGRTPPQTAFGVELLVANSNRGEALLNERVLTATAITLDRLKALGVQSVSLSLQYPVLTADYPRAPEFREFYRQVAAEIRRRGLRIVAEMGSAFREPELSRLAVDYSGLKRGRFNAGLREMAEAIIADIRPDFLTILSEPDTQTRNTGLTFSPSEFAATVRQVARNLDTAGAKLGAGAGTWIASEYFKKLADIAELDYLDLHIYPIQYGFASDRALKAAEVARSHGKRVAIGEAWLYKATGREFGRIAPAEVFARDVYSFWQTLDDHFLEMVVNLARAVDAEFCSFFWMKYLYGYVDYTPETARLAPGELLKLGDRVAGENILKGTLSPTGERFRDLIRP
jgi:hypothetical protein